MKKDLRAQFLGIYANLPLGIRRNIICVLDKEGPISWFVAWIEISEKTEISKEILKKLKRMEII